MICLYEFVVHSLFNVAPIVYRGFVLDPCFVINEFVSFLVLQREGWLLYFCGILNVMFMLSFCAICSWCHGMVCFVCLI